MKQIRFDVLDEHAPALLAAVIEISDTLATRVEGKFTRPTELALTRAVAALPALRLALTDAVRDIANAALKQGRHVPGYADPDYTTDQ